MRGAERAMKKTWVILVNVLIMIAMLTFVVLYSNFENRETSQRQIEHFENTTITMEHVTQNYLEGEQRICDVWARYINSEDMTIEEAVSFIRVSYVLPNASAHIVYIDCVLLRILPAIARRSQCFSVRPRHEGTSFRACISRRRMSSLEIPMRNWSYSSVSKLSMRLPR